MKSIIIVAHKFLPQPDDELVYYLNQKKYSNIFHICHQFNDAPNRRSYFKWYKNGKICIEKESADFKLLPEPLLYLKEFLFTIYWILSTKLIWDEYIGMDGLCTNFGLVLRLLSRVNKVIFWAIDFVPTNRFSSRIKNYFYHKLNIIGYKQSDEMWDLSPRMKEARKKFLGIDESVYHNWRMVPYGMWNSRIKKFSYKDCDKNTLVFMGHIIKKQGVQYVLKVIPNIIKLNPKFKFKIIGEGNYKNDLENLAKKLNVNKYCLFVGKINDSKKMEKEIAKSCLAIAPYDAKLDAWTYYADPGKVKTYLACGVPVLLTDVPWNAKEIQSNKCGEIIKLEDAFDQTICDLMLKNNDSYRNNAINYSKTYDYNNIFGKLYP